MEASTRALLAHACAWDDDRRPDAFKGNPKYKLDYVRKLLEDEINFMEARSDQ